MRKGFTVVLCVLTFVALVSCSNEKDEIVSINFRIPNSSRAITETIDGGNYDGSINDLQWFYKAEADSQSIFKYGETNCSTIEMTQIDDDNTVFRSVKDISLSKGKWSFTLWGVYINDAGTSEFAVDENTTYKGTIVYQGSANALLIDGTTYDVPIEISNIIPDTDCTIIIGDITINPKDGSAAVVPNTVQIDDGTPEEYVSGKEYSVPAGQHTIIVSYVTKYKDGDTVTDTVTNASVTIDKAIGTLQKFTIAGDFDEDATSIRFNGILTDGSLGNVYDANTNTYYNLVEDESTGEYKWENDNVPTMGADSDLILLDCSQSNNVPEDMLNDYYTSSAYNWTVYHPSVCTHVTTNATTNALYSGGYGTKLEPYEINSWSKFNNTYLYRSSEAYYKWTGSKTVTDNYHYRVVILKGSFDGNGATFNITGGYPLFYMGKSISTIKNFKIVINTIHLWWGNALFDYIVGSSILFKNIEVSGTIMGYFNAASFFARCYQNNSSVTFENCTSTADIINLFSLSLRNTSSSSACTNGLAGFISDVSGNGNYTDISVTLKNSSYTGNMYQMGTSYEYNYVTANRTKVSSITDEQYDDNVGKLYTSSWVLSSSTTGKVYKFTSGTSTAVNTYSTKITVGTSSTVVTATSGATKADFYYIGYASINNINYHLLVKDTQSLSGTTITSTNINTSLIFTLNQSGSATSRSGNKIDIVDPLNSSSSTSLTLSAKAIVVLQRDNNNKILQCNYKVITKLSY